MFACIRSLFKPNPYIGKFKGWKRDRYTAWSADRKYNLWIVNGFMFFRDTESNPLVTGLPRYQRKLIWKALMQELQESELRHLEKLATQARQNLDKLGS